MEEKEEGGISLGDIFRTMFSQKWLLLILAVIIAAVSTVGVYMFGKLRSDYSVSFVLQLPSTSNTTSTTYYYPDGESFYFTDIISSDRLAAAIQENNLNIDANEIIAENAISITRNVDRLDTQSKEGVYDLNYVVKVKTKFFASEDDAKAFIRSLVSFPQKYIATMDINYDKSLTTSKDAVSYPEQLSLLQDQMVYLQGVYNTLIASHGGEFTLKDGKTLTQCKDEIDAYLSKGMFDALSNRAQQNGYIKNNTDEKIKFESDLYYYEKKLEVVTNTLEEFKKSISGSTQSIVYDKIVELNKEIAQLNQNIEITQRYLASYNNATITAPADYVNEVAKVESVVVKHTDAIKPVASYVYEKVTKVNYLSTKIIEVEGGFSLVMSGAAGVAAGLLVGCIVAYIVGRVKESKLEVSVEKTSAAYKHHSQHYPDAASQLQIAVTLDDSKTDKPDDKKN